MLIKSTYGNVVLNTKILTARTEFISKKIYTHNSNETISNFHSISKNYKLQVYTNRVKYITDKNMIRFTQPKIIIFNKKNIPIWKISCNHAQLIEQNILNLYGYVCINKIVDNQYTESIMTKQVSINFKKHNIISDNKTIIHGYHFYSVSSKIYIDLQNQTIKLFGKIYTQYAIKQF